MCLQPIPPWNFRGRISVSSCVRCCPFFHACQVVVRHSWLAVCQYKQCFCLHARGESIAIHSKEAQGFAYVSRPGSARSEGSFSGVCLSCKHPDKRRDLALIIPLYRVQQVKTKLSKDTEPVWINVRVRMAAYLADLEEQWDLLSLKHAGTMFPDVKYLVPRDQLNNTTDQFPLRTEEQHRQVSTSKYATCSAPCPFGFVGPRLSKAARS
jgi:hypothetical protein